MGLLTQDQIQSMDFSSVGNDVRISDKASFYNCKNIRIGDNVRIDDFCIISAGPSGVNIGSHVHIAGYCSLIGAGEITISDFCGLSSRVSIYSSSDDYSGDAMTNPTIPSEYTNVTHADVFLEKHVIIGSGSVILPGATLEEGCAIAALSLVAKNCEPFSIYAGTPARFIKTRKRGLLKLERSYLKSLEHKNK